MIDHIYYKDIFMLKTDNLSVLLLCLMIYKEIYDNERYF